MSRTESFGKKTGEVSWIHSALESTTSMVIMLPNEMNHHDLICMKYGSLQVFFTYLGPKGVRHHNTHQQQHQEY